MTVEFVWLSIVGNFVVLAHALAEFLNLTLMSSSDSGVLGEAEDSQRRIYAFRLRLRDPVTKDETVSPHGKPPIISLSMKAFFRFILLALVLVVVALVSALTAMRFAIHGREVAVPNLVGTTPSEARKVLEENGLALDIERQYYSADVPEGRVLSQAPPSGTTVRRGWTVRVSQSLGPQRVTVPSVIGDSERAAEINIRRRGLELSSVAQMQMPGTPADQVLAQSPPPNASGIAAPKLSLLVAEPSQPQSFVMPNLVGQALGTARIALQDAGLRVGTVTISPRFMDRSPNGDYSLSSLIESQDPAAGKKVTAGAVVNFEVR